MTVQSEAAEAVGRFSAVLAHEEFRTELGQLLRSQWHRETPQEVRSQVLKVHKNRCTFEVAVKTRSGWHSVIAKVHTVDRSDVFVAMQAVVNAGFGLGAEFAIPQPLAYLSSLRVLLEEKVEGIQAAEVFLNGGPDEQIATAQRCGAWLARFHTVAPRLGKVAEPSEKLPALRYWTGQVKTFGDQLVNKSDLLLWKLEAAVPGADTFEPCAAHGSYIPEHVFLTGGRTVTIDLDEHDLADPGRDLAWFIVSLQRLGLKHLGSLHAHDRAVEAFLQAYTAARHGDALEHLPFYKAAECLHRARRDVYKRIPPIREWAEIMLDEGLRTLANPRA